MEKIADIITSKGGIVTKEDMAGRAEYDRVRRAVERGELIRLKHGVYADPTTIMSNMIDVERIVPGGIVCLYNAWSYYNLSTTVPSAYCIAIEAKRKVKTPDIIPVQLCYWKHELLNFGITEVDISGFHVRITDMERCVCDAVKYRNKVGTDVCTEVVRNYLKLPNRNLSKLTDYAQKLRVANVLRTYLEIALE